MAKNIVVFSDGTGQEGGDGPPTNVYRLYNAIVDRTSQQMAFYDRGLGTGWRRVTGNVSGAGISKNIKECYRYIFDHFESGDQIFLFGFSRGATTVRSLSGFIHLFGMLPKARPELIDKAWKIYKVKDRAQRESKATRLVDQHHTMWTRVKFLGVWDTVGALGVPNRLINRAIDHVPFLKHSFHDLTLSHCVDNAYQALSIDDRRELFRPLFWEGKARDDQTMEQVWFPGVHTDVGGGYAETGLADITFRWMLRHAETCGLRIYSMPNLSPDADGHMHDSRRSRWARLIYTEKQRSWDTSIGPVAVHQSTLERTKSPGNEDDPPYDPWIKHIG